MRMSIKQKTSESSIPAPMVSPVIPPIFHLHIKPQKIQKTVTIGGKRRNNRQSLRKLKISIIKKDKRACFKPTEETKDFPRPFLPPAWGKRKETTETPPLLNARARLNVRGKLNVIGKLNEIVKLNKIGTLIGI